MAKERAITEAPTAVREEAKEEGCCESRCGPSTCDAPAAEAAEPIVEEKAEEASQGGCCEPDCGPDTCS